MTSKLGITLVALGIAWTIGCNSPTLPLPPPTPAAIDVWLDTESEALVTGQKKAVQPYALVTCFNNRTGTGSVGLANELGAFTLRVPAKAGDTIEVWQRIGNDPPSVAVRVR